MRRRFVVVGALVGVAVVAVGCFAPGPNFVYRLENPDRITVAASDGSGATVVITRYVQDILVRNTRSTCDTPPDDHYPIGETVVTCRFTDPRGPTVIRQTTVVVSPPTGDRVVQIDVDNLRACAVYQSGSIRCWGQEAYIEDGAWRESSRPIEIDGISTATQVAVMLHHVCALLADRTVSCWGVDWSSNSDGLVPDTPAPTPLPGFSDVVQLSRNCALLGNGTVKCLREDPGSPGDYYSPPGVTSAVQITNSCARLADGTAMCWGSNAWGQLGLGMLTPDADPYHPPAPVVGLSGVTGIDRNGHTTCAVLTDQTARCWGAGEWGERGDGTQAPIQPTPVPVVGLDTVRSIAVGNDASCAILADGRVNCWGPNTRFELGTGVGVAMPVYVTDPWDFSTVPVQMAGVDDAVQLSLTIFGGCVLMGDASVRCWGDGPFLGESVDGMTAEVPVTVSGLD
jgi:Regulator of chromosome condensation (RCC1) repeat